MTADSKARGMHRRAIQLTITQSSCRVLWINNCLQTCKGNHCALVSKNLTTCLHYAMKQKWAQLDIQLREFINGDGWNKEHLSLWTPASFESNTTLGLCSFLRFLWALTFFISKMVTMVFQTWVMNGKTTRLHSEAWMTLKHSSIYQPQQLCQGRNTSHWHCGLRQWSRQGEKWGGCILKTYSTKYLNHRQRSKTKMSTTALFTGIKFRGIDLWLQK